MQEGQVRLPRSSLLFYPVATNSLRECGPLTRTGVPKDLRQATREGSSFVHLLHRLSLVVHRGNVASVLRNSAQCQHVKVETPVNYNTNSRTCNWNTINNSMHSQTPTSPHADHHVQCVEWQANQTCTSNSRSKRTTKHNSGSNIFQL